MMFDHTRDDLRAFGDRARREGARAVRRLRLGFLLIWRTYRPPAAEIAAQREQRAEYRRALDDFRLAAEEYHWAVASRAQDDRPGG